MSSATLPDCRRLLVVLPNWIGDAVMATPTLRALRQLWPGAEVTFLGRPNVRPILEACGWHDRFMSYRQGSAGGRGPGALPARLRRRAFEVAVLLPNSFRSALSTRLGSIPRRVGYDRDGRGFLLTDRLQPPRQGGRFLPVPMIDYYLKLAIHLGASDPDRRMELGTSPQNDRRADRLLRRIGAAPGGPPLVVLNPGAANHEDAKLWPAERFAAVGDALGERHGALVLLNGAPAEQPILDAVRAAARRPCVDLGAAGSDLRLLKSILKRAALVISNDTGPRHVAAALGTPVVSLFGPTDPQWTLTGFSLERMVHAASDCAACRAPHRRLTHSCMAAISVEAVLERAEELLGLATPA